LRGLKFDVAEQVEADERTMKRAIQEFGTSINCRILTTGCLSVSRYVHDAAGETAVSKQF
jgi:hypothetical protein